MAAPPWQDEAFLAKNDLYLAAIDGPLCKIGVSKKPKRRVAQLSTTQPHKAKLIKVWPKAGHFEPVCHHVLMPIGQRGEWFKCSPGFAQWICEAIISKEREKAGHAVLLYKQLTDSEARYRRLERLPGNKEELSRLLGEQMSLEEKLRAAGFNGADYGHLSQDRELGEVRESAEQLLLANQRSRALYERLKQEEYQKRDRAMSNLSPRQIAALRALVTSNGLDEFDAFTFDVLGSIGLLTRRKGSKAKTDWQLTDKGRAALEAT
jgi:hypothetical protein